MDRLLKFNPDIVFVEDIVNVLALDYLQSKGVTVVCKVKPNSVERIKKVCKIRKKI